MSVFARIHTLESMRARIAIGAVLCTVAAGGVMGVTMHKHVTIDVDGQKIQVATMTMNVDSLLESQGYQPASGDMVSPSPDSSFSDGQTITFHRKKQVVLDVEGQKRVVETTAVNVNQLLAQQGLAHGADQANFNANGPIPVNGAVVDVTLPKKLVIIDGGVPSIKSVPADTVSEASRASVRRCRTPTRSPRPPTQGHRRHGHQRHPHPHHRDHGRRGCQRSRHHPGRSDPDQGSPHRRQAR